MKVPFERAVDIVDYKTLDVLSAALEQKLAGEHASSSADPAAALQAVASTAASIVTAAERADRPSGSDGPAIALTPETSTECRIKFSLTDPSGLCQAMLFAIQDVLLQENCERIVWIVGKEDSPASGLLIFITNKVLLCGLKEEEATSCQTLLDQLGISLN